MRTRQFDDDAVAPVLEALRTWLSGNPRRDQPFLMTMARVRPSPEREAPSRALTPAEFVEEVEKQTEFGAHFLKFLITEAEKYGLRPEVFIWRAVEANRQLDLEG